MYHIDKKSSRVVSSNILITGACRSGTSLMSSLIHSCKDVELAFEPPLLKALIPLIDNIEIEYWKLLFESFLFEEFLMQAVDGRRLNYNQNDDSSIVKVKTSHEIEHRIRKQNSRINTYPIALEKKIAFKLPEIIPWLDKYKAIFPQSKVIVMLRAPSKVIESLLRMKWFSDEYLFNIDASWLHQTKAAPFIPFWVPKEDIQNWEKSNELERCCYYYTLMYENITDKDSIIIDYDKFVKNPFEQFDKLIKYLGLKSGELQHSLLGNVNTNGISNIKSNLIPKDRYKNLIDIYNIALSNSI